LFNRKEIQMTLSKSWKFRALALTVLLVAAIFLSSCTAASSYVDSMGSGEQNAGVVIRLAVDTEELCPPTVILLDHPDNAAAARVRAIAYDERRFNELMALDVPADFTFDERQFYDRIMRDVRWDAGFGRLQTTIRLGITSYMVWTDRLTSYLAELGYTVDSGTNTVCWR
jgi:hypothetical protein